MNNNKSNRLWEVLSAPFGKLFPLFILIFLLSTWSEGQFALMQSDFRMFLTVLAHGVVFSYLLTFLIGLIRRKGIRRAVAILAIFLLGVVFYTDMVCLFEFHSDFSADFIAILLGTDPSESSEFIGLHFWGFLKAFLLLVLFLVIYFLMERMRLRFGRKWLWLPMLAVIGCAALLAMKPVAAGRVIKEKSVEGKIYAFCHYIREIPPDYADYVKPANLEVVAGQPENIVIIFGESHCRSHCSFYGYDKETMPHMRALLDSGYVTVFDNVTSPGINTLESFKSMMSTYKPEYGDKIKFYTCQTVPQVVREAGYRSSWISNQSPTGLFNNIIANFAALCDTSVFIGDKFKGNMMSNLDEELLPVAREIVEDNPATRQFYVFHLMGSHPNFEDRYPEEYAQFTADDYSDRIPSQRPVYANYDNSILYTDHIVSEIIDQFRDQEAVVIYLSDHALDFFFTRDDYFSHALASIPESVGPASEVPFLIYTTEKYRDAFPEICERMREKTNVAYRTDDLIYTIMDLAGVRFKDASEVNGESILQ